jgi:proton glutamate symport protein
MKAVWTRLTKISLTRWIFVGMALGIVLGYLFPEWSQNVKPLSSVFLRMIKSIIVPIIFSTLVIGIAGHGDDLKQVGRLAFKSLVYFEVVTTIALIIGLFAVNITKPGTGIVLPTSPGDAAAFASNRPSGSSFLEHLVPQSIFEAGAHNEVLQIVFFAVVFGVALSQVRGKPKEFLLVAIEGLAETMFKFTGIVMRFAPIGIGAAIAVTVGHSGLGILINLGKLVLTLYGALIVFAIIVFIPALRYSRVSPQKFLKAVKEPALIAFSTTSSEAALPKAMEAMEGIGVPRRIVSFVMPTGYSFNLDGTTLYLSLAAVFAAQAAGIDLSWQQQALMLFSLMITSKGVAGVPRASLVILSGTLATFGLPLEAIAVILGVDELMDMARTTVNLVGNCLATLVMARWEGELPPAHEVAAAA